MYRYQEGTLSILDMISPFLKMLCTTYAVSPIFQGRPNTCIARNITGIRFLKEQNFIKENPTLLPIEVLFTTLPAKRQTWTPESCQAKATTEIHGRLSL